MPKPSKPLPTTAPEQFWRSPWPDGVPPALCELCSAQAARLMVLPLLSVCAACAGKSLTRVADAMLDRGISWLERIPPLPE